MGVNVAFTSTGYGPLWAPAVSSWLRVVAYTARHFAVGVVGKIGGAGVTDRMYTHQAENALIQQMLEAEPAFTHIFMTESDMILPHDCIVKLLELDKDMASGVYFLRSSRQEDTGQPCLYKRAPLKQKDEPDTPNRDYLHTPIPLFPTDAPFRVDCAGLGCLLLKRRVFEVLPKPWFDLKADGYGSDMYFSTHARKAGLELWADPRVLCGQVDYYETTVEDWKWRLENVKDFATRGFIVGYGEKAA